MISRLPPFFFSVCRAYVQAINSRSTAISANNANYKQAPQNPKSYKREKKAATYGEKPGLAHPTHPAHAAAPAPQPGCCARSVLAAEQDFKEQKGRLQEELEFCGQLVIFYPKFHCELNFIERYW